MYWKDCYNTGSIFQADRRKRFFKMAPLHHHLNSAAGQSQKVAVFIIASIILPYRNIGIIVIRFRGHEVTGLRGLGKGPEAACFSFARRVW